jgi:hypothetical protein
MKARLPAFGFSLISAQELAIALDRARRIDAVDAVDDGRDLSLDRLILGGIGLR